MTLVTQLHITRNEVSSDLLRRDMSASERCDFIQIAYVYKKSLQITKGYSEAVNRRTDNTMVNIKKDKGTNNDPSNTTQKTND